MTNNSHHDGGTTTIDRTPKTDIKKKRAPRYKVYILNDDFTPMDFVQQILMHYFRKSPSEAVDITNTIHTKGIGLAGVYTAEVAETKVGLVAAASAERQYPLRAMVEKE